jgi:Domain of unknown function (DUF932)
MSTLTQASRQWASRPSDERFLSLTELFGKVDHARAMSRAKVVSSRSLTFEPTADNRDLRVIGGNGGKAEVTHWSFGQLASLAKAPAGYLRTLPAPIAADNLNYGLKFARDVEDVGVLLTKTDAGADLRAATGPNYGRIWNADIVRSLIDNFGDGRTGDFRVPGEFGQQVEITRSNTTIYGSDRDMFVFLADEENRVQVDNRRNGKPGSLARGFFVWNSEVGASTLGIAAFLFDYVCMNRIVWGAEQVKEIRLRHTSGAPDRWIEQIAPVLVEYSKSSAKPIEEMVRAAQAKRVDDDLDAFLAKRFSFTAPEIRSIKAAHEADEGRPMESLWDISTGITAMARDIEFQDARVALERKAGKVLDLVAA